MTEFEKSRVSKKYHIKAWTWLKQYRSTELPSCICPLSPFLLHAYVNSDGSVGFGTSIQKFSWVGHWCCFGLLFGDLDLESLSWGGSHAQSLSEVLLWYLCDSFGNLLSFCKASEGWWKRLHGFYVCDNDINRIDYSCRIHSNLNWAEIPKIPVKQQWSHEMGLKRRFIR